MLKIFEEKESAIFLTVILCILVFIVSEWIFINVPNETRAQWFAGASILILFISLLTYYLKVNIPFVKIATFGEPKHAVLGLILGSILAIILVGKQINFGTQSVTLAIAYSTIPTNLLQTLYAVFLSPTIEELVFRAFLVFTTFYSLVFVSQKLGFREGDNSILFAVLAIIIPNTAFGLYHYYVASTTTTYDAFGVLVTPEQYMISAFMLGIIWTIGYLALRSITFPLAFHMLNNAIVLSEAAKKAGTDIGFAFKDILIATIAFIVIVVVMYYLIVPVLRKAKATVVI